MLARFFLGAVVLCCALSASVRAAEPEPVKISFTPAAAPLPALRYQFQPSVLQRHPGNAALHYMKAMLLLPHHKSSSYADKITRFLDSPAADYPLEEAEAFVAEHASMLSEVQLAVTREHCDWQLPIREQHPYAILLPEIQEVRSLARILAIKARCEMERGKLDDAFRTLGTGLTMSHQVSESHTIISALVGIAVEMTMLKEVERFIATPGSPNLYWAIQSLPQPMHDLQPALEVERYGLELTLPALENLETLELTEAGWQNLLDEAFASLEEKLGLRRSPADRIALTLKVYLEAKPFLTARGWTAEQVDAMPVAQAVLLHDVRAFRERRDQVQKYFHVPYWHLDFKELRDAEQSGRDAEALPLSELSGGIGPIRNSQVRAERHEAILATIEALRMHAAAHGGKLPATLAEVTLVPVPLDPATNQPFSYQLKGDTATLLPSAAKTSPQPNSVIGFQYELTARP